MSNAKLKQSEAPTNSVPILVAFNKLMSLEEEAAVIEGDLSNIHKKLSSLQEDIEKQRHIARSSSREEERKSAEAKMGSLTRELQQLTDLNKQYWPRPSVLPQRRLANRCKEWLAGLPQDCRLELVGDDFEPGAADALNDITDIRNRITALKGQIATIQNASPPPDRDALKRDARQFVERLAETCHPTLSSGLTPTLSVFGSVVWPIGATIGSTGGLPTSKVLPLLAALIPDAFIAALERSVDNQPVDQNYLPDDAPLHERSSRIASLREQIFELELVEEATLKPGEARRADASPEAVLGLRLLEATESKVAA